MIRSAWPSRQIRRSRHRRWRWLSSARFATNSSVAGVGAGRNAPKNERTRTRRARYTRGDAQMGFAPGVGLEYLDTSRSMVGVVVRQFGRRAMESQFLTGCGLIAAYFSLCRSTRVSRTAAAADDQRMVAATIVVGGVASVGADGPWPTHPSSSLTMSPYVASRSKSARELMLSPTCSRR